MVKADNSGSARVTRAKASIQKGDNIQPETILETKVVDDIKFEAGKQQLAGKKRRIGTSPKVEQEQVTI